MEDIAFCYVKVNCSIMFMGEKKAYLVRLGGAGACFPFLLVDLRI